MIDVLQHGAIGNGNDEYGILQEIIDKAPEGSLIYFPGSTHKLASVEYVTYQPLLVTKSLSFMGANPNVTIRGPVNSNIFLVQPVKDDICFSIESLNLLSSSVAVLITSSNFSLNPVSKISDVQFRGQTSAGLQMNMPQLNLRIFNCNFRNNQWSIKTSSSVFFNNFIIRDSVFQSSSVSAIKLDKASGGPTSGSVKIMTSCFLNNAEAINLNNFSGTLNQNLYLGNQTDIVTSGSAIVILIQDNI